MSFPTVPDINPNINIKQEDAIVLLLISIALEEISLSDLINAEAKKINFVVGECGCNESSIQDLKDINRSVNRTLQDIIKLQMLLQFKLENVIDIVSLTTSTSTSTTTTTSTSTTTTSTSTTASSTSTTTSSSTTTTSSTSTTTTSTSTTATSTSTTTTSSTTTKTSTSTTTMTTTKTMTTTSTTSTSSSTTKHKCDCECSLNGRGLGLVFNPDDEFFGGTAILQACVCVLCGCIKDSLLCYSVKKGTILDTLTAFPESLIIECPSDQNPDRIVIKGIGTFVRIERPNNDISYVAGFELIVLDNGAWEVPASFHMIITVNGKPEFNHDSGLINAKSSNLKIGICPSDSQI